MPYARPQEKIDKVQPEYRTGVQNGDHLHWIHATIFMTCLILCIAMLALQSDGGHRKMITTLTVKVVYCIALGGVSSRAGVLAGYLFLSLHSKGRTRTDEERTRWIVIIWGVIAFFTTYLYSVVTNDATEDMVTSLFFSAVHYLWMIVPFVLLLKLIKLDPRQYFKKP